MECKSNNIQFIYFFQLKTVPGLHTHCPVTSSQSLCTEPYISHSHLVHPFSTNIHHFVQIRTYHIHIYNNHSLQIYIFLYRSVHITFIFITTILYKYKIIMYKIRTYHIHIYTTQGTVMQGKLIVVAYTLCTYWNQFS